MNIHRPLICAIIICFFILPAMGGVKYLAGSPEFDAAISGTNEFSPGEEVPLTILVENSGLNIAKIIRSDIIDRDDVPNTAKLVKVELDSGGSPILVKSDKQMIGDIPGGTSKSVTFVVKIDDDAESGTYSVPLVIEYTHLSFAEEIGTQLITYTYSTKEETHYIDVNVKSDVSIEISEIATESLNVGTEGYIDLNIINTGNTDAEKAIIRLARNGNSPLVPTDSSVYAGSFPSKSTITSRFKVAVSSDAEEQTYPLDVYVEYQNEEGEMVTSDIETMGVPVGGKIDFEVISTASTISPGQKKVLEVEYRNSGAATVYDAQARISAVDPFSSNDDTAYLGDIAPGKTATARFEVSVDSTGTVKSYGLDSEIRYRDALDNSQISDAIKVQVEVVPQSDLTTLVTNPVFISVIAFLVIAAGYYVIKKRKSS
jgi:hypothetical protein